MLCKFVSFEFFTRILGKTLAKNKQTNKQKQKQKQNKKKSHYGEIMPHSPSTILKHEIVFLVIKQHSDIECVRVCVCGGGGGPTNSVLKWLT